MVIQVTHLTATQRYTVHINGQPLPGVRSVHLANGVAELLVEKEDGSLVRLLGPESTEAREAAKAGRGVMNDVGLVKLDPAPAPAPAKARAESDPAEVR